MADNLHNTNIPRAHHLRIAIHDAQAIYAFDGGGSHTITLLGVVEASTWDEVSVGTLFEAVYGENIPDEDTGSRLTSQTFEITEDIDVAKLKALVELLHKAQGNGEYLFIDVKCTSRSMQVLRADVAHNSQSTFSVQSTAGQQLFTCIRPAEADHCGNVWLQISLVSHEQNAQPFTQIELSATVLHTKTTDIQIGAVVSILVSHQNQSNELTMQGPYMAINCTVSIDDIQDMLRVLQLGDNDQESLFLSLYYSPSNNASMHNIEELEVFAVNVLPQRKR